MIDPTTPLALLIPLALLCMPIAGLVVILSFVVVLRYLRMKETAMLLERGIDPALIAQERTHRRSRWILFTGFILSMVGLAISIALYPIGIVTQSPYPLGLGPWMMVGFLPLFIGISLVLWHYLGNSEDRRKDRDL